MCNRGRTRNSSSAVQSNQLWSRRRVLLCFWKKIDHSAKTCEEKKWYTERYERNEHVVLKANTYVGEQGDEKGNHDNRIDDYRLPMAGDKWIAR